MPRLKDTAPAAIACLRDCVAANSLNELAARAGVSSEAAARAVAGGRVLPSTLRVLLAAAEELAGRTGTLNPNTAPTPPVAA
jgi:hypothetical protein